MSEQQQEPQEPQQQQQQQEPQQQQQEPQQQQQQQTANPYESVIQQQTAQIAALMEQNKALNEQVISMVQGGAQITSKQTQQAQQAQAPQQNFNPESLANDKDYTLEGLADLIGKKGENV